MGTVSGAVAFGEDAFSADANFDLAGFSVNPYYGVVNPDGPNNTVEKVGLAVGYTLAGLDIEAEVTETWTQANAGMASANGEEFATVMSLETTYELADGLELVNGIAADDLDNVVLYGSVNVSF